MGARAQRCLRPTESQPDAFRTFLIMVHCHGSRPENTTDVGEHDGLADVVPGQALRGRGTVEAGAYDCGPNFAPGSQLHQASGRRPSKPTANRLGLT
jgi:hypothetical protein